jgi:hypothetical protein
MRFLLLHAKIYPLPLLRHSLRGEREFPDENYLALSLLCVLGLLCGEKLNPTEFFA